MISKEGEKLLSSMHTSSVIGLTLGYIFPLCWELFWNVFHGWFSVLVFITFRFSFSICISYTFRNQTYHCTQAIRILNCVKTFQKLNCFVRNIFQNDNFYMFRQLLSVTIIVEQIFKIEIISALKICLLYIYVYNNLLLYWNKLYLVRQMFYTSILSGICSTVYNKRD